MATAKINKLIKYIDDELKTNNNETETKDDSESFTNIVLGAGNPLLDISCSVDKDFLKKYDLKPANAILADAKKHATLYDELSNMNDVEYIAGGATLNSIRVCQWMLQNTGKTGYMGCIGNDKYGKLLQESVKKDGVNCNFMIHKTVPTGTCAVCITDKERSLVANLAAANEYSAQETKTDKSKYLVKNAGIIYNAGFFITVSPETLIYYAKECQTKNIPYCINFSAPFIVTVPPFLKTLLTLMEYATHVFTNDDEIKAFANSNKIKYNDVSDLALKISKMTSKRNEGRKVICTQGKDPIIIAYNNKIIKYNVPLLKPQDIVDLNGAGDAFVGGYLSQLIKGKSDDICVDAGNYAARYIIQTSGTKLTGKPTFVPKK